MKPPYFNPDIPTYFGGKGSPGTYQTIINHIPPHDYFISLCLGNCAVMRYKKPAQSNFGFDPDPEVIRKWEELKINSLSLYNGSFLDWDFMFDDLHPIYSSPTFIYVDPPYLLSSRKDSRNRYKYEMKKSDHIHLLDLLVTNFLFQKNIFIAVSCYPNQLYKKILGRAGWHKIEFQSSTRRGMATEQLWMNYDIKDVGELHDYSYLGETFRDRERIKRKQQSLLRKYRQLTSLEQAMFRQSLE